SVTDIDHGVVRIVTGRLTMRNDVVLPLAGDHWSYVLRLNIPARQVGQRGRPERLAGAEAECGVVPGTPDRLANDETLGERPPVVRAASTDGRERAAAPREQDWLAAGVTEQSTALRNRAGIDAHRQVRPRQRGAISSHFTLPLWSRRRARFAGRPRGTEWPALERHHRDFRYSMRSLRSGGVKVR